MATHSSNFSQLRSGAESNFNDHTRSKPNQTLPTNMLPISATTFYYKPHQTPSFCTSWRYIVSLVLIVVVALTQSYLLEAKDSPTGITKAYGDPIKWSFGGWAPLEGVKNATMAIKPLEARQYQPMTSPLPLHSTSQSMDITSTAENQQAQPVEHRAQNHSRHEEQLNELASGAIGNVHFAPSNSLEVQSTMGKEPHLNRQHPNQGNHRARLETGPAYMLPSHRPPPQFSSPAPTPIVRDHLIPTGNHHRPSFASHERPQENRYSFAFPPAHMPPMSPYQHPMMHQNQFRNQHSLHRPMPHPPPQTKHPPYHHHHHHQHQHQQHVQMQHQKMQQRHRHQMMQHHHAMQLQQQHSMQNSHQAPHQPCLPHMFGQLPNEHHNPRTIPCYPGSTLLHHQLLHNQPELGGQVGTFKVIENEQPILFASPLVNERIPMIEVSGHKNETQYGPRPVHDKHEQAPQTLHSSTMAAIEKENMSNYQNALDQSQSSLGPLSNSIQDVKQRQYSHSQQSNRQAVSEDKPTQQSSSSKPSYLTIPVAVETEGDKVLTADDISEIEKHVINVLPNLKTADKVVKLADTQLTMANLKESIEQEPPHQTAGPELHQTNYDEHKSTMKQLEEQVNHEYSDGNQQNLNQSQNPHQQQHSAQASTLPASGYGSSSTASINQAITTNVKPHSNSHLDDHHYFVAAGPLQELGAVEPDQLSDYNLIKNDLLNSIRYEPTRANSALSSPATQTGSTPPMPHAQRPSMTRFFHHGPRGNSYRAENGYGRQRLPGGSTTRTILGGRKVSEVMRPLIHTTPIPMTSPQHVQSVEPEKLDAIQLIAGQANDKHPMVVEAHQLVHHTPDGGIDYNSGTPINMHQNQTEPFGHPGEHELRPQHYAPQEQPGQQDNQGAIIEYVTLNDQVLNQAISQHPSNANNQSYEVSGGQPQMYHEPSRQNNQFDTNSEPQTRAPFMYDYTISNQQQQSGATEGPSSVSSTPPGIHMQINPVPPESLQPSLAWSPSVASEHQQQQIELSEHVQQMDLPATAGYNFFAQQQEHPGGQQQEYSQHQQQQQQGWRTKAGGSQPNPDAQYDGQIAKSNQEPEISQQDQSNDEQHGQQFSNYGNQQQPTAELSRLTNPQEDHHDQQQQQQEHVDHGISGGDSYQQQYQDQNSTPTSTNLQSGDRYLTGTSSPEAGNQINHHQNPSHENYDQQYNQQQSSPAGQYSYMKLDHEKQQNHLAQHQAQHQAQLAEIMASQQPYQTTTPVIFTTVPNIEQHQQEGQQQQPNNNNNNGYMVEQVQSRPSVQSSPDSMIINEPPILNVPILDQQSLISDSNQDSNAEFSEDDGAKQRQQTQPAAVYQVYQAYYAPKDHKPLPGYVRLSLEEFNEFFRDAEIQYVSKNSDAINNHITNNQPEESNDGYQQSSDMRASASENHSILVDGRSIPDKLSTNSSTKTIRPSVRKIISIKDSKHLDKQVNKPIVKKTTTSSQPITIITTDGPLDFSGPDSTKSTRKSIKDSGDQKQAYLSKTKFDMANKKANNQQAKIVRGHLVDIATQSSSLDKKLSKPSVDD